MSSRITSLWVAGLFSLGVLFGCPTRSASEAIVDGSGGATTSPHGVDASAEANTTTITVRDDAGVDAQDLDDALDPVVDGTSEQQKPSPDVAVDLAEDFCSESEG